MITFQANYRAPVTIGKAVNKNEILPYKAAMVELNPNSKKDVYSLNLLSMLPKKTGYASAILNNFIMTKNDILYSRKRKKIFFALTEQQDSYEFVKPKNILGLAELSISPCYGDSIYLQYLQTVKKFLFNKTCFVGKNLLDFIKQMYPKQDIELYATPNAIKFYKNNDFVIIEGSKNNGLTAMKYFHQ